MDLLLPRYEVGRCDEDESVLFSFMLSLVMDDDDDLGPCALVAFATDVDLLPLPIIECSDGDEFKPSNNLLLSSLSDVDLRAQLLAIPAADDLGLLCGIRSLLSEQRNKPSSVLPNLLDSEWHERSPTRDLLVTPTPRLSPPRSTPPPSNSPPPSLPRLLPLPPLLLTRFRLLRTVTDLASNSSRKSYISLQSESAREIATESEQVMASPLSPSSPSAAAPLVLFELYFKVRPTPGDNDE